MPVTLFIIPLLSGLISLHSVYWFLPVCFGIVSLAGYLLKNFFFLDLGIILSILTFLFAYRATELSFLSLLLVIGFVFLHFGVWILSRNSLIVREIKDDLGEVSLPKSFNQFRKSSANEIMNVILFGIVLSFIGYSVASFSVFQTPSEFQITMIIVFSSIAFLTTYLIFLVLPSE